MRDVVLYTLMSLDGAVDDPDRFFGNVAERADVPEFDDPMVDNESAVIAAQDAVLLGRSTYEQWSRYWPTAPHEPFATFINTVKKYVATSAPLSSGWHNCEAVHQDMTSFVRDLKSQPGGDIGIHGSIQLAQSMLAAGLVDRLHLVIGPRFGFAGRRLFPDGDHIRGLKLISVRSSPSGSLLVAYSVR